MRVVTEDSSLEKRGDMDISMGRCLGCLLVFELSHHIIRKISQTHVGIRCTIGMLKLGCSLENKWVYFRRTSVRVYKPVGFEQVLHKHRECS